MGSLKMTERVIRLSLAEEGVEGEELNEEGRDISESEEESDDNMASKRKNSSKATN